jgi:hypothetical protein
MKHHELVQLAEKIDWDDLARDTVDRTVLPKNITFPTDAKLLHAAITGSRSENEGQRLSAIVRSAEFFSL